MDWGVDCRVAGEVKEIFWFDVSNFYAILKQCIVVGYHY